MRSRKAYTITLDDDPMIHKIIGKVTGMTSIPFASPEKLIRRSSSYKPIAVFCDIHLGEGISGLDFVPTMREAWEYAPIIVMTNDPQPGYIGKALALGANDYIKKPLVPEELLARMHTRINETRSRRARDEVSFGDVTFNRAHHSLQCRSKTAYLAKLESNLFLALSESGGRTVNKRVLQGRLWGQSAVSLNALDKKISNLRSSLRDIGSSLVLQSVYGEGVALRTRQDPTVDVNLEDHGEAV